MTCGSYGEGGGRWVQIAYSGLGRSEIAAADPLAGGGALGASVHSCTPALLQLGQQYILSVVLTGVRVVPQPSAGARPR